MRASPLLASLLVLGACAGPEGEPPSLAPRAIEGVADRPVQAIAPVASATDPALAARIAELVAQAEQAEREFRAALPAAQRTIAAAHGSAPESESWIVAQLTLSALDGARSPTTSALGELDGILAGQALAGEPAELERLTAARERVAALYGAQNDSYDALAAALTPR